MVIIKLDVIRVHFEIVLIVNEVDSDDLLSE